tara:strand:- start:3470 stop:3652 length:183 start_codon:yes stop_codon:yes gene_type:complete
MTPKYTCGGDPLVASGGISILSRTGKKRALYSKDIELLLGEIGLLDFYTPKTNTTVEPTE